MFIASVASRIVFDDLTRYEVDEMQVDEAKGDVPQLTVNGEEAEGEPTKLSVEEENRLAREMTAGFPDWISSFFRQVITLFEALPEPGKNNRNGGKTEDSMIATLTVNPFWPRSACQKSLTTVIARLRFRLLSDVRHALRPGTQDSL